MFFNSFEFVFLFLPLTIIAFYKLKYLNVVYSKLVLLVSSLIFYLNFNIDMTLVLIINILINYFLYLLIKTRNEKKSKKIVSLVGVFFNLSILAYFKYFNFFVTNINLLFNRNYKLIETLLPIGISFYIFQAISIIVDSVNDDKTNYSFLEFSVFLLFFAHITSGPLVRHDCFINQLRKNTTYDINYGNLSSGISLFIIGLGKKVLVADFLLGMVDWGYENYMTINSTEAILIIFFYAIQIYFDFSGYSDMATGIAKMFNLRYPLNFDNPYKSLNIEEFWKKWHMTLTDFFTRYIYIPLGGSRQGKFNTYRNILIVFLVSGLWHGANWNFIIWGIMHGTFLVFFKINKKTFNKLSSTLNRLILLLFINYSWVLFRSTSLLQAKTIIVKSLSGEFSKISSEIMLNFDFIVTKTVRKLSMINIYTLRYLTLVGFLIIILFLIFESYNFKIKLITNRSKESIILLTIIFLMSILNFSGVKHFIYTNF